jgi:DNA-binding CsgD family transcriptional regulator
MERLTGKDLRNLSHFFRELYQLRTHGEFTTHLVHALPAITEGDFTSCMEFAPAGNAGHIKSDHGPFNHNLSHYTNILVRHLDQHPINVHMARTNDGSAHTFSDFVTQREFRKTDLYHDFYKPLDIPYLIGMAIAIDSAHVIAIARHRNGREFGERSRTSLNVIRPHVVQAFRNALALSQMQDQLALLSLGLESAREALVSVTSDGRIRFATPLAETYLAHYGLRPRRSSIWLASPLRDWVAHHNTQLDSAHDVPPPMQPLVVKGERGLLRIRLVRHGTHCLLLLKETRQHRSEASLAHLRLSPRETEILGWVVNGKTSPEIGLILGISPRTVHKHLEHIYSRLGVENRHAAISLALSDSQPDQ